MRIVIIALVSCLVGCAPTLADTCSTDADCVGGNYCDEGLCIGCSPDIPGCPCENGACGAGLSCGAGSTCEVVCGDGIWTPSFEECDADTVRNGTCTTECELFCDLDHADCDGNPENGCECEPGAIAWGKIALDLDYDGQTPTLMLGGKKAFGQSTIWTGRFESERIIVERGAGQTFTLSMDFSPNPPYGFVTTYDQDGVAFQDPKQIYGSRVTPWFVGPDFVGGEFTDLFNGASITSVGFVDAFVTAFSGSIGTVRWTARVSSVGLDRMLSATTLSDGSIVVGGVTCESVPVACPAIDLTSGTSEVTALEHRGLSDGFVARFGLDGALAWGHVAGGPGPDVVVGLATIEPMGDGTEERIAVIGNHEGPISLGTGNHETALTSSRPSAFIAMLDSGGAPVWAISPSAEVSARALAVTAAGGTLYALLRYRGELTIPDEASPVTLPGDSDKDNLALIAVDPPGRLGWAKRIATGSFALGPFSKPYLGMEAIEAATGIKVFIGSAVADRTEFAPDAPNFTVVDDVEGSDIFIAQVDGQDGDLLWLKRSVGAGHAYLSAVVPVDAEVVIVGGGVENESETIGIVPRVRNVQAGAGFVARFEAITP